MTQYVRYPLSNLNSLLSGYVPYVGATTTLNLNTQRFNANSVQTNDAHGFFIKDVSGNNIAQFQYSTDYSFRLVNDKEQMMYFHNASNDIFTQYIVHPEELASIGYAADIGSWGRGNTWFEIKYNTGDTDWAKVLYLDSSGVIRNPNYIFTGDCNLPFECPSGLVQFGDYNGTGNGVQLYIDTAGGQIVFGSFISGDSFYYDYSGVMIFSFASANLYTFSGTSLAIETKLTMSQVASSATDGDLFHDSTQKQITAYTSGVTQCLVGTLFTQTADATVASTTTATSIIGTGIGTLTLPANFEIGGKTIEWTIGGKKSATVTPVNITIEVLLGATVIGTTGAVVSASGTNYGWEASGLITCRTTGGSGVIKCSGRYTELIATGANVGIIDSGATINTAASQVLSVKVTWGTSSATNTITSHNSKFIIEN